MCETERGKSGVCGSGLNLNTYGRHVWLGDTYDYERKRTWLGLHSHSGERTQRAQDKHTINCGLQEADCHWWAKKGAQKFEVSYIPLTLVAGLSKRLPYPHHMCFTWPTWTSENSIGTSEFSKAVLLVTSPSVIVLSICAVVTPPSCTKAKSV